MLKRPITFTSILSKRTETQNFYFDLQVDELALLELDMPGGLSNYWKRIIEEKDAGKMLHSFKALIAAAYGERNGEFFMKETESGYSLGRRFLQHPAYHVLFMELLGPDSDDEAFSKFLESLVPPELAAQMKDDPEGAAVLAQLSAAPSDAKLEESDEEKTIENYSRDELLVMDDELFDKLAGTDPQKWNPTVMGIAYQRKAEKQARDQQTPA